MNDLDAVAREAANRAGVMTDQFKQGLLVSDFNLQNLAGYLRNDRAEPRVQCVVAPYGQVIQVLLDASSAHWSANLDFAVAWTQPQGVLPSFAALLDGVAFDPTSLKSEVEAFAQQLGRAAGKVGLIFVPLWAMPGRHYGQGMLDLAPGIGVARALMEANLQFLTHLDRWPNIFPLNTAKWVELAGEKSFNPRMWYTAKVPYGNEFFKAAVRDIKAALRGAAGRARKLIILDLDDTLWGGIVGELGWQNLVLGGHDAVGEALSDFQRELKALARRGVLLAIASKNDETTALDAIRHHPEMVLQMDDFAGWRINWQDKAQNVAELVASLNLGLDATVFIDDSPVERARVREALPDVLVPDWPEDQRLFPDALRSLDCFDRPSISEEDRRRTQMYLLERRRSDLRNQVSSLDDWLRTLDLQVNAKPLSAADLGRTAQLLNKTNQMNLSTRRMSPGELIAWADKGNHRVWTIHVTDKFGDSGLTGILSLEVEGFRAQIIDFVLSCRVLGRKIEETMLYLATNWARSEGIERVDAVYFPTAKNKPCLDFLQRSGLRREGDTAYVWDAACDYPLPPAIRLTRTSSGPSDGLSTKAPASGDRPFSA